jgi:hypothetical protein
VLNEEERELIFALVAIPGKRAGMSTEEFLRKFGESDGIGLGLHLLTDALRSQDSTDIEYAMIVCFRFGFSDEHVLPLVSLAFVDWHKKHEDVASALDKTRSSAGVDALRHLAEWVPSYLQWDEARALATKVIWGLGKIRDDAARSALEDLAGSDDAIVANCAREQLERSIES